MQPVSNHVSVVAGSTVVGTSVISSMTSSSSLYRASWEQILSGQFELIVSDVVGLVSMLVLLVNLSINVCRWLKDRKDKKLC